MYITSFVCRVSGVSSRADLHVHAASPPSPRSAYAGGAAYGAEALSPYDDRHAPPADAYPNHLHGFAGGEIGRAHDELGRAQSENHLHGFAGGGLLTGESPYAYQ